MITIMPERLVKCPCRNCSVAIEFDAGDFQPGMTVNCPVCHEPTHHFLAQHDPALPKQPANQE